MDRLKRAALLTTLIHKLRDCESWCGETHVQKAVYISQEMLDVPTGFDFILYKHGPFSFDLRDELTSLRADELIDLQSQPSPYGPRFVATEVGEALCESYPKTLKKYDDRLEFVASTLGERGVADLERLATALYVTKKLPQHDQNERADKLRKLKPHISTGEARAAVAEIDELLVKVQV